MVKITFLVHSLYTIGGTIRTTLNTASALADKGHQVSLISVFQHRQTPLFSLDDRVTHSCLIDVRNSAPPLPGADAKLAGKPSKIFPVTEPRADQYSRLADVRVRDALQNCDADVIVGTRPGLNVYLAKFAPEKAITVGQEHLFLKHHDRRLTAVLRKAYRKLDAVTTVSAADAHDYRRAMPDIADRISHIPNAVPETNLPSSTGDASIIVAAGRLEKVKRYDLLLAAFAQVVETHPQWQLRIYGHGKESTALRELVTAHGLHNHVFLMGTYTPIDAEWVKGSIAAVTSDIESFGLTIVEAMDCGLPVVATACPYGPPEIITDTVDGLLTPPGDVDAFAVALRQLIEDPRSRKRMGHAAKQAAGRYKPSQIGTHYDALFRELHTARGRADDDAHGTTSEVADVQTPPVVSTSTSFAEVTVSLPSRLRHGKVSLVSGDDSVAVDVDAGEVVIGPAVTSQLREDIWLMHVDDDAVPAGQIDARALVSPPDRFDSNFVIPTSVNKRLGFRVWSRDVYAEVDQVAVDDDTVTVDGTFYGASVTTDEAPATLTLREEPDRRITVDAMVNSGRFRIPIAKGLLGDAFDGEEQLWDLRIHVGGHNARVGKKLDDLANRKKAHKFPGCTVNSGATILKPYFTINNGLSIKMSRAS